MENKNSRKDLEEAIEALKYKQKEDLRSLKEQLHEIHESLKPINLIKETFHNITSSPDIKNNLLHSALGLASGYLSKKVLVSKSDGAFKKILGNILQFAVTGFVSKHADSIIKSGENIVRNISNNKNGKSQEFYNLKN